MQTIRRYCWISGVFATNNTRMILRDNLMTRFRDTRGHKIGNLSVLYPHNVCEKSKTLVSISTMMVPLVIKGLPNSRFPPKTNETCIFFFRSLFHRSGNTPSSRSILMSHVMWHTQYMYNIIYTRSKLKSPWMI